MATSNRSGANTSAVTPQKATPHEPTAGAVESAPAAVAPTQKQLLGLLTDCDSQTQEITSQIEAAATAAHCLLKLDVISLATVSTLLQMIADKALELQDEINSIAGNCGADHVETGKQALRSRLWDEYHALRNGGTA